AAMRALGAELVEHGDDFHAADHHADKLARERALFRMPSFDPLLVRGVASYALEFFRGAPALDSVFVPVGWGSGAVGLAAARNALGLKTSRSRFVGRERRQGGVCKSDGERASVRSQSRELSRL